MYMRTLIVILVLALLAAITTVIFALGNPGIVSVQFLKWSFDSSLTVLMLAPFVLGLLLGWLVGVPTLIKHTLTIASNKKKVSKYELDQAEAEFPDTHPVVSP
jgi:lipopolysaccharide assembly protein A